MTGSCKDKISEGYNKNIQDRLRETMWTLESNKNYHLLQKKGLLTELSHLLFSGSYCTAMKKKQVVIIHNYFFKEHAGNS